MVETLSSDAGPSLEVAGVERRASLSVHLRKRSNTKDPDDGSFDPSGQGVASDEGTACGTCAEHMVAVPPRFQPDSPAQVLNGSVRRLSLDDKEKGLTGTLQSWEQQWACPAAGGGSGRHTGECDCIEQTVSASAGRQPLSMPMQVMLPSPVAAPTRDVGLPSSTELLRSGANGAVAPTPLKLFDPTILRAPMLSGAPPGVARLPRRRAHVRGDTGQLCIETGFDNETVPVPFVTIDTTGDGFMDALLADTDGDGRADALVLDTSSNGVPDTAIACLCFDTNSDGIADVLLVDTTDDGHADTLIRIFSAANPVTATLLAACPREGNPAPASSGGDAADDGPAAYSTSTPAPSAACTAAIQPPKDYARASPSALAGALSAQPQLNVVVAAPTGDSSTSHHHRAMCSATGSRETVPSRFSDPETASSKSVPAMHVDDDVFSILSSQGENLVGDVAPTCDGECSCAASTYGGFRVGLRSRSASGSSLVSAVSDSLVLPLPPPLPPETLAQLCMHADKATDSLSESDSDAARLQAVRGRPKLDGSLLFKQGWTPEEDETIVRMVQLNGQKWSVIACALPGRTDDAVRNRYLRLQKKKSTLGGNKPTVTSADLAECQATKKGDMWTAEEDAKIMEGVQHHGFKWQLIAHELPGRSANAVRNRYLRCSPACSSLASAAAVSTESAVSTAVPPRATQQHPSNTPPAMEQQGLHMPDLSDELNGQGMNLFWDAAALYGEALESIQEDFQEPSELSAAGGNDGHIR